MLRKNVWIVFTFLVLGCQVADDDANLVPTEENPIVNSKVGTDQDTSDSKKTFDRQEMLTFIVNQIIIPSFNNLEDNLGELKSSFDLFNADLTDENFEELTNQWLNSYKAWQHVEMFNIGKAMEEYYVFKSNIYPVDTVRVKSNIESGAYDLENPNNYSAQGFPTIEYLLFGPDDDPSKGINQLRDNIKYRDYLKTMIESLVSHTKAVKEDWVRTKEEFVLSTENTASSNLNMMVNDFIYYFEKGFIANKFGIPAGVFSPAALPDRVEGYYSKIYSKEIAMEALSSIKNFFNGISVENKDVTGPSLKSYLNFIESGKDHLLSDQINEKLSVVENSINALDQSFVRQMDSDLTLFLKTYDNIQSTVVLLKVDMLQVLNISVDYADADGD